MARLFAIGILLATIACRAWAVDDHFFQQETFTFQALNLRLPKPLSDFTASFDPNTGLVYLAGGCDSMLGNEYNTEIKEFICTSSSQKLYRFDKDAGTFTTLKDMPTKRYRHGAALVNNQLWLLGGRDTEADNLLTTVDVYNIADDTWTTYDLDETTLRSDNAGFADKDNSLAFFVGGYNSTYGYLSSLVAIDTVATTNTGTITTVAKAPLLLARGDLTAVAVGNDYAIATGGFGEEQGLCEPLVEAERYDFAKDQWELIDSLKSGRGDKALVEFKNHVFALGGERQIIGVCALANEPAVGEKTVAVDDVEVYHPETDTWEVLEEDLPNHRFRFAAIGFDDIDSIYAFGGQRAFDASCQCFRTTDEIYAYAEHSGACPGPRFLTGCFALVTMLAFFC